jgi:hypothetical protein
MSQKLEFRVGHTQQGNRLLLVDAVTSEPQCFDTDGLELFEGSEALLDGLLLLCKQHNYCVANKNQTVEIYHQLKALLGY